jgi:hypothetical protein
MVKKICDIADLPLKNLATSSNPFFFYKETLTLNHDIGVLVRISPVSGL